MSDEIQEHDLKILRQHVEYLSLPWYKRIKKKWWPWSRFIERIKYKLILRKMKKSNNSAWKSYSAMYQKHVIDGINTSKQIKSINQFNKEYWSKHSVEYGAMIDGVEYSQLKKKREG